MFAADFAVAAHDSPLEIFTLVASLVILDVSIVARGFGGRHALDLAHGNCKEVIQMSKLNVGSVASLGALVGSGLNA
jgi:hypothetical protein